MKQAQEKGPFENNQSIVASICVAQQLFKQQCPEQEIPKHLRFESLYPLDIKYCMGDTKKMLNGWKQVFEERGLSTKFNENGHSRKTENPVQSPKRQDSLNSSTGPNTLLPILHKNGGKGF